jgi:seryl-tRNA synthetase
MTKRLIINEVSIDTDTLNELKTHNSNMSEFISKIGELYIKKKTLQDDLEKIDSHLSDLEFSFNKSQEKLNTIVLKLENTYKNGRIDLEKGLLFYTTKEEE